MIDHAKAPWRVGPVDDTVVIDADGNEVASIDGDYNEPDLWPVMEANARLIAAAPDLMSALCEMLEMTDEPPERNCSCHINPPCGDCVDNSGLRSARKMARAALAKAEGRS